MNDETHPYKQSKKQHDEIEGRIQEYMNTLSPSARPSIRHTKPMTKDEAFDVIANMIDRLRGERTARSAVLAELEEAYDVLETHIEELRDGIEYIELGDDR